MVKIFKRSFLILAISLIVIALIALAMPKTGGGASNGLIQAKFSQSTATPGETVYLTVTLKNNLGKDLHEVEVKATAIDNESLKVSNSDQFEKVIGMNEVREFKFPVQISKEARAGVYSIEIDSNLKEFKKIRVPIKIKSD